MAVVTCEACGAKNRVDPERAAAAQPTCGRCGTELRRAEGPVTVTDATFDRIIRGGGSRPVLLDCWAPWCGPCRMLAPELDRLAAQSGGRFVVAKLNVDENPRTAEALQVRSIPALFIFKHGSVVEQLTGAQPASALAAKLQAHLD
ncbi:MAG: thioredoxin [Armatimonadota bacterium]